MAVIETERLSLSHLTLDDCDFIIELLNEPSFSRYIGDKGVRTVDDARQYLEEGPICQYREFGYGLYRVVEKGTGRSVGICGLVNREAFDTPDLGFAFLKAYWSQGYATESSAAVMRHARDELGMDRVIAMADGENQRSTRVLDKLGFTFETMVTMPDETEEVRQYVARI